METIGFIGTGHLGYPIAANLLKAGYGVKIYNRTREKALPLEQLGAVLVNSPEETAVKGGIVLSLVADDKAVEAIATAALLEALGQGGIHVSMSTISPDTSRALAAQHLQQGVQYVTAPVFARPEAAEAKVGNAVISGNTAAKERIKPLLQAGFAKHVFDLGEDAGSANVLKLIGNFMIAGAIELMAESFALAEKNKVDPRVAYEMLTTILFPGPIFSNYGAMILDRQFTGNPSFSAALGLKDMDLVLQTARRSYTPMPLANLVQSRLTTLLAKDIKDADWIALASGALEDAGL
ncbi:3-hydroxyisobutyrate dehydrogenase-like beta-hydroxyacid dehydrogenase [Chitinophaga niastensis]|uniref:3-hydroxyisobutyrate dehydrogenase-like beta-hydroxyacid dehydrogenase n=1 Tax=Chitinophaga niastensis TaxID=536980 RepID=A0A2P8HF68_CHINA|nr:NAD(P)-dependent oxidoreductase [Chitinophaga niastensis]PSL44856.1 3-hydroxyisobutyrate dehydrogenase-like beta-hydroxyacid dehydrogenase [Chitinophaga niastensis]